MPLTPKQKAEMLRLDQAKGGFVNKNHRKWFGQSKVADAKGRPITMYHGARPGADIKEFDIPKHDGAYFTPDPEYAQGFTKELFGNTGAEGAIYPTHLSLKNPYIVRAKSLDDDAAQNFLYRGLDKAQLQRKGHDGAMLYINGVLDQAVAFHPTQIKSAIGNRGTYDPKNPDITMAKGGLAEFLKDSVVKQRLYHGTAKDFGSFSHKHQYSGEGGSHSGSGFYFTDNPEAASRYSGWDELGSNVMPVHLNIKKPLHFDWEQGETTGANLTLTPAQVRTIMLAHPKIKDEEESPLTNWGDIRGAAFHKTLNEAIKSYAGTSMLAALRNDFFGDDHERWLRALHKATGYDSATTVTPSGERHYIAWFPEQIKSAIGNRGTYDPNNPDITKAAGGNVSIPSQDVMRLAIGGDIHFKHNDSAKQVSPQAFLHAVKPLDMDKDDKQTIAKFKAKMKDGKKINPLEISKTGYPDGRHRATAAKELGVKKVPVIDKSHKLAKGGSILKQLEEYLRQHEGEYGVKRLQRAADEIPGLESMYTQQALREAFGGDNAKALMTMNPADFEKYSIPLKKMLDVGPKMSELAEQGVLDKSTLTTDDYIKHLAKLHGFSDVPYLQIDKQETGLPLIPQVKGHEGRHRSQAFSAQGKEKSLVRFEPSSNFREQMPRRYREDFIDALRQELAMKQNLIYPEKYSEYGQKATNRPPIVLPDVYKSGGKVTHAHHLDIEERPL